MIRTLWRTRRNARSAQPGRVQSARSSRRALASSAVLETSGAAQPCPADAIATADSGNLRAKLPVRPNPIIFSLVEFGAIEGATLRTCGLNRLDGTLLL